jgi:SlyX protein
MELNDTTNDATLDNRLTNLEVKATYNEDLLEQLEQVIIKQQQQIESLTRQIIEIKQASSQNSSGAPLSLRDELPPHF